MLIVGRISLGFGIGAPPPLARNILSMHPPWLWGRRSRTAAVLPWQATQIMQRHAPRLTFELVHFVAPSQALPTSLCRCTCRRWRRTMRAVP